MAISNTNQNPSDFEEYIRDLLECPVCMETIKSVPVYQCANGHVICKGCIEKLSNCPICRNNSSLRRSLKLEKIVQRLEGIQLENGGPTTANPNLHKWGKGSVRVYGTIEGPSQVSHIELNLQANPEPLNSPANNEETEVIKNILIIFCICGFVAFFIVGLIKGPPWVD